MDDLSVSKGVFAHCKRVVGSSVKRRKSSVNDKKYLQHKEEPWYKAYKEISLSIDETADGIHDNTFRQLLYDLRDFVVKIKDMPLLSDEIPTGILLAGVNLPDHDLLLKKLENELESVTPYIATVWSKDASNLKSLIEEVIYQIINNSLLDVSEMETNSNEIKKTHCTFGALNAWHEEKNNGETPLVIIIPDFESFHSSILHDFILILSSYMKTIKFILIFGVATNLHVVHRSLSYDATSKLKCQVFQMQQQVNRLSDVLKGIISSQDIPFKVIDRAFTMLVDMFLWYDFSVDGFLKKYKVCLWKHFYNDNTKLICCKRKDISDRVAELKSEDFSDLKKLKSIKDYLKGKQISDTRFKQILMELLEDYHDYMDNFLIMLNALFEFSGNLNYPFGKTFRHIYLNVSKLNFFTTKEYKEAILKISYLSKDEILSSITAFLNTLNETELNDVKNNLEHHYETLKNANNEIIEEQETSSKDMYKSRHQMRDVLKKKLIITQHSAYKKATLDFVKYLDEEVFQVYLKHPSKVPIYEIFCFCDVEAVDSNIKGSTKASIYNCLNNPSILSENPDEPEELAGQPDLHIVYKLHLENRKMINMYDWLQAFVTIVNPDRSDEEEIDPVLHARFTQAVAELQFLGFIKTTKRKTDHVKKLTVN